MLFESTMNGFGPSSLTYGSDWVGGVFIRGQKDSSPKYIVSFKKILCLTDLLLGLSWVDS